LKKKGGELSLAECIFCKIVNKEIPSDVVYENDFVMVFKDIFPKAPIHLLLIPKKHIERVVDVKDEDLVYISEIWKAINKAVDLVGIKERGFRLIVNSGKEGKQEVLHLHFHIIGGKQLS
jgi:histidine triad (HIT) family protein